MSRIAIALAATSLLAATPTFAASTAESRYHKIWEKLVTFDKDKPKVACICLASGALGALAFIPGSNDFVYCGVPSFNPDGSLSALTNCGGAYAVLSK